MAATFERGAGGHVAERVRPVPGSAEAERLERLAADGASGWRRIPDDPAPDAPQAEQPAGRSRTRRKGEG